jgi:hypothetical protein
MKMPPLSNFDTCSTTTTTNVDYSLPLEFKPRLDLWSLSGSSSFDSLDKAWAKQPAKRRSVRFASETTQIDYIHVNDLTYSEVEAAWYRRSDFRQFRMNREIDTHDMSLPQPPRGGGGEIRCTAGLETPQESLECRYRIRDAVAAVLEEQKHQRAYSTGSYYEDDCDNFDVFAIAERYGAYAFHCRELSRYRGEEQAMDVQVYHRVARVA